MCWTDGRSTQSKPEKVACFTATWNSWGLGHHFAVEVGRREEARRSRDTWQPWEPITFIFRGYNPYIGCLKPSFFHGFLRSKGSHVIVSLIKTAVTKLSRTVKENFPQASTLLSKNLWRRSSLAGTFLVAEQWFVGLFLSWECLLFVHSPFIGNLDPRVYSFSYLFQIHQNN